MKKRIGIEILKTSKGLIIGLQKQEYEHHFKVSKHFKDNNNDLKIKINKGLNDREPIKQLKDPHKDFHKETKIASERNGPQ